MIENWCKHNFLSLSPHKCKSIMFSYGRVAGAMPAVMLDGHQLETVTEIRYLGVILQQNVATWNSHSDVVLKRARAVMFTFRNYYAQFTKKEIILHVFKSIVRPILEYCAEVVLPSAHYTEKFERIQKLAVSLHFHDFTMSSLVYEQRLLLSNLSNLHSRRAASSLVSFIKIQLGAMHVEPGYFCFRDQLKVRSSNRTDSPNDCMILRNFQGDIQPRRITAYSASFKKNFFYRSVTNFNNIRRGFDLWSFTFKNLKKILQLLNYNSEGLVIFN